MHDATDVLNEPVAKIDDPSKNKDAVRIAVLVDESGSMLGAAADTVSQLNSYLDEQGTRDDPILVSVYTFNSRGVRARFSSVSAKETPRLKRSNDLFENPNLDPDLIYAPSGGTPLYDAIGEVITKETTGVPTLVVILTDGQENESKEYRSLESIQTLIKAQEDQGWTFTFLMAGLNRAESVRYTSQMMGRDYNAATMTYAKGSENMAFKGLVGATAKWEASNRAAMNAGIKLGAQSLTEDFYEVGDRDIKEGTADIKTTTDNKKKDK